MTQESLTFASRHFGPSRLDFSVSVRATLSGAVRLFSVIPKAAPKSIVRWACGVSGCRVFVNSSLAYRAVTVNTALGYKLWI